MTEWDLLAARAVDLVRQAAPELAAVPIYLVPQSITPFAGSLMLAFTHPRLDVWVRSAIGERWEGRGVCVVVNDALLAEEPDCLRSDVLAAHAVHEAAHAIADDGWALTRGDDTEPDAESVRRIIPLAAERMSSPQNAKVGPPGEFDVHGVGWLRTVLTMRQRLEDAGVYLAASRVVGHRPELSRPEGYAFLLRDETNRTAGLTFAEILATPAPPKFVELWEQDRRDYYANVRSDVAEEHQEEEMETMSQTLETVTRFVGKVAEKFTARQRQRADSFAGLVARIADGKGPREEEVLDALESLQRSPAELEAAVGRLLNRRRAAATVAAASGVSAERAKVDREAAAAEANLNSSVHSARLAYEAKMGPIRARSADLERLEKEARAGMDLLVQSHAEDHPLREAEIVAAARELDKARLAAGRARVRANEVGRQAAEAAAALKRLKEGRRLHRGTNELLREAQLEADSPKLAEEAAVLTAAADELEAQLPDQERRVKEMGELRLTP